MSVAWTTVAVIVLLLPGILFFNGVATYDRLSREIIRSNVIGEVALAIVVALIIHTISISALSTIGFRLTGYLRPVADYATMPPSELLAKLGERLFATVCYLLGTALLGFIAGALVAIGIVSGPFRRFAMHKWVYDVIDYSRKGRIVTAYIMTTMSEADKIIMYKGRVHEFFLSPDGKLSYVVLKNCAKYFMKIEEGLKTTKQQEILGTRSMFIGQAVWNYFVIDGSNIANVLFDSSPEIKETTEGEEALRRALEWLMETARRGAAQSGSSDLQTPARV
jgi:hypothetical protein